MFAPNGQMSFREFQYGGPMKYRTKESVREARGSPAANEQMQILGGGFTQTVQAQVSRLSQAISRASSHLPQFSLFRGSSYMIPSSRVVPNEEVSQELREMRRQLSAENLRQAAHRSDDHIQSPF